MEDILTRRSRVFTAIGMACLCLAVISPTVARAQRDPAEPLHGKAALNLLQSPTGAIPRQSIDQPGMRSLIEQLVSCGTRHSLSSWTDPRRGAGCGRDHVVARLNEIAKASAGRLQVVIDKFEGTGARTNNKPAHFENVYGLLPGRDPRLSKTVFIVSGHFDSRASDVMDPNLDAPGADDDASGVAVSVECARLLSHLDQSGAVSLRASLLFAAVSGEEQGTLGAQRMLDWLKQQGYVIGGMLDDDIVGADFAPGAPHRVRLFSGGGIQDDADSPSRELARAIEEITGRQSVRMIFSLDRLGRGGDHEPFYRSGLPAVRFTEPLEDYHHQHQTPRNENGMEYGDQLKHLNMEFIAGVARVNAEALRQLALAPAAPVVSTLAGGITPDAKITFRAEDDPERAGFELLWRETTEPRWQVYDFVKNAGENVLKEVSTDNHFFAVRSVGKNGAHSIAVPASAPRIPPASGTTQPAR